MHEFMAAEDEYYFLDMARLPLRTQFLALCAARVSWFLKFIGAVWLPIRRILPFRGSPWYGIPAPERISRIDWTDLPDTVRDRLTDWVGEFENVGYTLVHCVQSPCIGGRCIYSASLLDGDGQSCAIVVWNQFCLRDQFSETLALSCASLLKGDRRLTTSNQPPTGVETLFFDQESISLPPSASVEEIVAVHRRRLTEIPRDEIDLLSADSLIDRQRIDARRVLDLGCRHRIYIRLTAAEIQRLQRDTLFVA